MTLGGLAAAVGLVIDDAIVVVENIVLHRDSGESRGAAIRRALSEIRVPLIRFHHHTDCGFPAAGHPDRRGRNIFSRTRNYGWHGVDDVARVGIDMDTDLEPLPAAAQEGRAHGGPGAPRRGNRRNFACGFAWTRHDGSDGESDPQRLCEDARFRTGTADCSCARMCGVDCRYSYFCYRALGSDLLPEMDEGGFVLDYLMPAGSSLADTNQVLLGVEKILGATEEVESTSRRSGLQLGLRKLSPKRNTGDFLVKLLRTSVTAAYSMKSTCRTSGEGGQGLSSARHRVRTGPAGPDRRSDEFA